MEIRDFLDGRRKRVFFADMPDTRSTVLYAGIHKVGKNEEAMRLKDHGTIHVILAGKAVCRSEDGDVIMEPGDVYCCLPFTEKRLAAPSGTCIWSWVGFHDPDLSKILMRHGLGRGGLLQRRPHNADVQASMLGLLSELRTPGLRSGSECSARLQLLINQVIRHYGSPPSTPAVEHEAIDRARKLILRQASEITRVTDLARTVGLERSYFSRLFHRHTGQTIRAALHQVRLQRAEALLRDHQLPIRAVAEMSGFQDYATFHRFFRRLHGCSPSAFRRKLDTDRP